MFKKFKERLQKRIEINAIKIPKAEWKDKDGNIHIEDIVLKRSKFPLIGDWGRIYPPLNEDGNINWINVLLGGKQNLIKLIVVMLIIAMMLITISVI